MLTDSRTNETRTRRRRSSITMRPECNAHVSLFSQAEYVSLAVSLVGLPALGVANHQQLSRLACALAKNINYTSAALALLNQEQEELRDAILDNRAAIDYLLLLSHVGCEEVYDMCCFNLTDNSKRIQAHIDNLQELAQHIQQDRNPSWWDDLWAWLPSMGWVRTVLQYVLIVTACLIGFCCLAQCIPNIIGLCFTPSRRKPLPTPQAVMYAYKILTHADQARVDKTEKEGM